MNIDNLMDKRVGAGYLSSNTNVFILGVLLTKNKHVSMKAYSLKSHF